MKSIVALYSPFGCLFVLSKIQILLNILWENQSAKEFSQNINEILLIT